MLLPVYGVVLVQSLATLEVEIWITGIDPRILPEGLDFPSSMAAFCSAVSFLRVLVIGFLPKLGCVSLISGNSTFKRGKTPSPCAALSVTRRHKVDFDWQVPFGVGNKARIVRRRPGSGS